MVGVTTLSLSLHVIHMDEYLGPSGPAIMSSSDYQLEGDLWNLLVMLVNSGLSPTCFAFGQKFV